MLRGETTKEIASGNVIPVAAGVVSFSLLAYQVMIPRLLSVLLSYHFVFAVLSLSLLSLALGGLITHLLQSVSRGRNESKVSLLMISGALCSSAIPLSLLGIIAISNLDAAKGDVLWYVIPTTLPFIVGGAFLACVYASFPKIVNVTYGADLVGAAVGAAGAVILMDFGGIVGPILFLGVVSSAGVLTLLFLERRHLLDKTNIPPLLSLVFCLTLIFAHHFNYISLQISPEGNPNKEIYDSLIRHEGRILETRWTSFGRTDLVAYPERYHMDFYLDGTAGSPMYRLGQEPMNEAPWFHELESFVGYFPLRYLDEDQRDNCLLIGPGGGRDVLIAKIAGIRRIVAVEVNSEIVNMAQKYAWYNGGIYNDKNGVEVVINEGRHYIKRQKETFDVIIMSLPVTNTSRSIEGFSLTENYLFTVESIQDYLRCLTDEGRIVFVAHDDVEVLRLLVLALRTFALNEMKPSQAMKHIWVVSSGDYLALVLKKSPFGSRECFMAYTQAKSLGYKIEESFFPFLPSSSGINRAFAALDKDGLTAEDLILEASRRGFDIRAVSDNNPFFYKFEVGLPRLMTSVAGSALCTLVFLCVAFRCWRKKVYPPGRMVVNGSSRKQRLILRFPFMFFLIGIGFICVEISLVQRFCVVFGQPVWTTAFILFSILVCGGVGSAWAGKIDEKNSGWWLRLLCGSLAAVIFISEMFSGSFIHTVLGWRKEFQIVLVFLYIAPMGVLMGVPFPLGVRALKYEELNGAIPWMWCFNGVASVIGACLSLSVAIEFGFKTVLMVSAACYLSVYLLFRGSRKVSPSGG